MKTVIRRLLIFSFIAPFALAPVASIAAVNAETIIPGYATVSHPSTVILKSKGCQNINFEYIVDEELPLENTLWLVQIVHATKNIIYGGNSWFSNLTYLGDEALPSLPRAGVRTAKVCRTTWVEGKGTNKVSVPGVKPGKYRLYFAGVMVDPTTGKKLGEKTEVFKSIIFK
jgi:hypothetical protein